VSQHKPSKKQEASKTSSEAICCSKMSVNYYWTTWHYTPQDSTFHSHCYENHKSDIIKKPVHPMSKNICILTCNRQNKYSEKWHGEVSFCRDILFCKCMWKLQCTVLLHGDISDNHSLTFNILHLTPTKLHQNQDTDVYQLAKCISHKSVKFPWQFGAKKDIWSVYYPRLNFQS
jgi:hypothetical protein